MSAMPKGLASPPASQNPIRTAVGAVGLVVALALAFAAAILWMKYGTTVFFEMIASGISACF